MNEQVPTDRLVELLGEALADAAKQAVTLTAATADLLAGVDAEQLSMAQLAVRLGRLHTKAGEAAGQVARARYLSRLLVEQAQQRAAELAS